MARDSESDRGTHVSTDRETIRRWCADHDVVPVHSRQGGTHRIDLVDPAEKAAYHEEIDWDRFEEELDRSDHVVVYHDDEGYLEVADRDQTLQQASLETEEVEASLLEGETVTTEITETTVVERTIVEGAEIESQVVDRERAESHIVDAELVSREVGDCELSGLADERETGVDYGQFEVGYRMEADFDVRIPVTETWSVTSEQVENLVIESEVVSADGSETETVEPDAIEETVDIEGVQQTILEGDLLESNAEPTTIVESESIESEFTDATVVETRLSERKTVEEELTVQKEFTGTVTDCETTSVEPITTIVESELSEPGSAGSVAGETAGQDEHESGREMPRDEDKGKAVVDATGEKVGEVMRVERNVFYVDPQPSLTDRVMRALDWGTDDDAYPVDVEHVRRITDDRIELTIET